MSYASVAATNAPPLSEQPRPDPALLNTEEPTAPNVADDTSKVGVVSHDFKENPSTITSEATVVEQYPTPAVEILKPSQESKEKANTRIAETKDKAREKIAETKKLSKDTFHKAEAKGFYLWDLLREQVIYPGVAGGLIGIVNLGLIGGAGYAYYTQPHLRRDPKTIASTAVATVALLSAEGYGAAKYRETPQGQEEERKARTEGAALYRSAREHILRPGVLGGFVGLVNVGIIGSVGYYAYKEWDRRVWDKRIVSGITAGLVALWGTEGYIAEQYREGAITLPKP